MKLNIDKSSRDSVMKFFTGGNWGAFRSSSAADIKPLQLCERIL
jgi:hypothetical protein